MCSHAAASDHRLVVGGVVLEWQGELPSGGEVAPLLLELVDRGVIRILDIALLTKDQDGSVTGIQAGELPPMAAAFAAFQGASSGLLGYQDLQEAAAALEPGTAALRRSGGQRAWRRRRRGPLPTQDVDGPGDDQDAANLDGDAHRKVAIQSRLGAVLTGSVVARSVMAASARRFRWRHGSGSFRPATMMSPARPGSSMANLPAPRSIVVGGVWRVANASWCLDHNRSWCQANGRLGAVTRTTSRSG
jgi:hypothetical protein